MSYHPQSDAVPVYKDLQSYTNVDLLNQGLFVNTTATVTATPQTFQQTEWQPSSHNVRGRLPPPDHARDTCVGQGPRCPLNPIQFTHPSSVQMVTPIQNVCTSSTSLFSQNQQNGYHQNRFINVNPTLQTPPRQNICINATSTFIHNQESSYTQNQLKNVQPMIRLPSRQNVCINSTPPTAAQNQQYQLRNARPSLESIPLQKICVNMACPSIVQNNDYRENPLKNVQPMMRLSPNQNARFNSTPSTSVKDKKRDYQQNPFVNTSCMYGSTAPLLPTQEHNNHNEPSWGTPLRSSHQHSKTKRTRIAFKTDQLDVLEKIFKSQPYVNKSERRILSKKLDLCDKSIKVWFQNRRIKEKKDNQPCDMHNEFDPASSEESVLTSAIMDEIDKEIQQPTDNGLVEISERALKHLYLLVNPFLPEDLSTLINENSEATGTSTNQPLSELNSNDYDNAHLGSKEQCDSIFGDLYGAGSNTNASKSSNVETNNISLCLPVYEPISPEPPLMTDSEYSGIGSPSHNFQFQEFFLMNLSEICGYKCDRM